MRLVGMRSDRFFTLKWGLNYLDGGGGKDTAGETSKREGEGNQSEKILQLNRKGRRPSNRRINQLKSSTSKTTLRKEEEEKSGTTVAAPRGLLRKRGGGLCC